MEFANRLAKYEPDALDSASKPRQGPDALGRQSADLQLGHAWVIKGYAAKVIFRKVYSLQMQWSSTSTHPDSHCCRAVENLSQLAISSTRKALFGLPPFASCHPLPPLCCQWLDCNPIHALQFFYFATGLQAGMAPAFKHCHLAPDISSYVFGRGQSGHSLIICRSAPLHPLRGQNLSIDFVWWISILGLSHPTFRIDSGGVYAAGWCCYPLFVGTKKAMFKFCSESLERIFIFLMQPPNIPTHTNAPVNNSACCWTFIYNAN